MKKFVILALAGTLTPAVFAQSFTLATFSDPAQNGSTPLFTWNRTLQTITGSWLADGLTLNHPGFIGGGSTSNVRMVMDPVALTEVVPGSVYQLGNGTVKFYTSDVNSPILRADFVGGTFVNPFSVGSSEIIGNVVNFSGPNVPGGLGNEQFAFSLANAITSGDTTTFTSAFTSSATPEPGTMVALAAGLGALAARRRRK